MDIHGWKKLLPLFSVIPWHPVSELLCRFGIFWLLTRSCHINKIVGIGQDNNMCVSVTALLHQGGLTISEDFGIQPKDKIVAPELLKTQITVRGSKTTRFFKFLTS
jgi:hypothetical protein